MKKIGFIGAYDKTDLILCIAKILTLAHKKVLVIDSTITQKCKYVVPVINPTKAYVTEYEGIDVAVGFENMTDLKQYLGLEENESMEYDYAIIDTDNFEKVVSFEVASSEKLYFVTSFDSYSLKKGIEILSQISSPTHITRIFYSKEILREEEEYFDYLALGVRVVWDEDKLYFLIENGDLSAIMENQRISKIKLRNLSNEYKDNVVYLVNHIDESIGEKEIRNLVKNL